MDGLRIVLPDGSMQKPVANLFERAGLPIRVLDARTGEGRVGVHWIKEIVFLRPQEIPHLLEAGHFDLGITGEDWIANWRLVFPTLCSFPMGRSGLKPIRIVLAVREMSDCKKPEDLPKKCRVATEYVELTEEFFLKIERPDIIVMPSFGKTERKIRYGAGAIVDVCESGDSLAANHLRIIHTLMESHTVLAANPDSFENRSKKPFINALARLLQGAFRASRYVLIIANVPENVLDEASRCLGGLKGPTCSPLLMVTKEKWFALQAFVPKEDEQEIILKLLALGVTNIAVNREIPLIMA